ncbi:MAG: DUF4398 domain-containing protein [Chromatiales bacterium]|nr:DUF4398 domain-containing protein [Chromatiales bacterium]
MVFANTRFPFLLCAVLLAACAATGPPVQEMSDARQAIAAAREAGAATFDSVGLQKAETQLAEAEAHLQHRVYWDARRLAVDAKETAIAALLRSRSVREQGASSLPGTTSPAGPAPASLPP